MKLIKELLVYQAALDAEDESDSRSNGLNGNIFQDDDFLIPNEDADSDDATGFLQDFYQELNLDNDNAQHKSSDLFATKVESGGAGKTDYKSKMEAIEALRGAMIPFIDKNERAH